MLLLPDRRLNPRSETRAPGEGISGGHTVTIQPLAPPAPHKVPKKGLEASLEKENHIVLPAPCPAVQSRTPILPDLARDHFLLEGKGIVVDQRAALAPRHVPPPGLATLRPAPLPGEGGSPVPLLVLAPGVSQGHGLDPLKDQHSAIEAETCTALHIGPTAAKVRSQMGKK